MTFVPPAVPPQFIVALWEEVRAAGHYRTNPKIDFLIERNVISMTATSTIVPMGERPIRRPSTKKTTRGLAIVDGTESYFVGGKKEDRKEFPLHEPADDRYFVQFQRIGSKKRVSDEHVWTAPVTGFTVTFKHGEEHSCEINKLSRPSVAGLEAKHIDNDCLEYRYPIASFSGQRFTWYVSWTD